MATTVQDIIYDARTLLDTYTEGGIVISDDELTDLTASCLRLADMGQKELYKVGRFEKTVEINNFPVKNELGLLTGFNILEYKGSDQFYPDEQGIAGVNSYYVEADSTHTIEIQELEGGAWSTLVTHSGVKLPMTAYKGNLSVTTPNNKIRMKMSGTSYYRHQNRALYAYIFQDDEDVPTYNAWIEYKMPADFKAIDAVVEEFPDRQYSQAANYKFEKPNRFYYNYYFEGNIRVIYKAVPVTITSLAQELDIDDIVAKALSFYVAAWISPYENTTITNTLLQKFEELKIEASSKEPASEEIIDNVYHGFIGGEY